MILRVARLRQERVCEQFHQVLHACFGLGVDGRDEIFDGLTTGFKRPVED